jgi:hypothetical protein
MIHRKTILSIACLLFVFSLTPWKDSTAAQPFPQLMIEVDRVPWTDLSYRAKNFMVAVNTHVHLSSPSGNEGQASLLASPRSIPVQPSGSKVYLLTLNTNIDPLFRSAIRILNQVWFDPKRASALGRIRLRRGRDDFIKSYRFTQHGVFRIRRGPKSKKEALLPPEQWTDVKDTFYSYDISNLGCPLVSERLILIYLVSAAVISNKTEPISLCVFGKRQLHHVQLRPEGLYMLKVDYIERTLQSETRRKSTVEALKIAILNRPIDSDLEETENFSFLGLHKDIAIWIDLKSRIPIQVSGVIPNIGKVALKLSEVKLRTGIF